MSYKPKEGEIVQLVPYGAFKAIDLNDVNRLYPEQFATLANSNMCAVIKSVDSDFATVSMKVDCMIVLSVSFDQIMGPAFDYGEEIEVYDKAKGWVSDSFRAYYLAKNDPHNFLAVCNNGLMYSRFRKKQPVPTIDDAIKVVEGIKILAIGQAVELRGQKEALDILRQIKGNSDD